MSDHEIPPVNLPLYFEPIKRLGEGGMGVVWSVKDKRINKLGALKAIRPGTLVTEASVMRFEREIRNFAQLTHPYIVQVYDVGKLLDGAPYIFMEEVTGLPFQAKLFRKSSFDELLIFIDRILEALALAHANAIIHRDLKPDNILVTRDETGVLIPKIMDFGLALKADEKDARITVDGMVVGTPIYMAPEQACDEHYKISPATDLYALGCILFELLSGKPPFDGKNAVTVLLAQASEAPPHFIPSEQFAAAVRLTNIIKRLLEKDPAKRFESAADLRAALRRLQLIRDNLDIGLEAFSSMNDTYVEEAQNDELNFIQPKASLVYSSVLPEVIETNYQYSVLSLRAPSFVGRSLAGQVFGQYLKDVYRSRRCAVCLITGRPGVGKSRFVMHFSQLAYLSALANSLFVDSASHEDVFVAFYNALYAKLLLRTLTQHQVPLAIAHFFQCSNADPRVTHLYDIFRKIENKSEDISYQDLRLYFQDILVKLCASKPLILVFDNVQNYQTASLKLVIQLLSIAPSCELPILTAVTNATINDIPTDLEISLGNNAAIWLRRGIALEPLSTVDMQNLIKHSLSISPKLAPYIANLATGYPKIAVSIARQWQLAGFLSPGPEGYYCQCEQVNLPVPKNVHEDILHILYLAFSAYPSHAWLPVAALASILGEFFQLNVLEAGVSLIPRNSPVISAAAFVNEALTGAVLRANQDDTFCFSNPLMRDAIKASLLVTDWVDLNIAAARAKKEFSKADELNNEIAFHYYEGRKYLEAFNRFYLLAKQTLKQGFADQSLQYIEQARLSLTQHLGILDAKNPLLGELWILEAEIYIMKGELDRAKERISWLKYSLDFVDEPTRPATIAVLQTKLLFAQNATTEALESLQNSSTLIENFTPPLNTQQRELKFSLLLLRAQVQSVPAQEILDAAKALNEPTLVAQALITVVLNPQEKLEAKRKQNILNVAIDLARKNKDLRSEAQALKLISGFRPNADQKKSTLKEALRLFEIISDFDESHKIHLELSQLYRAENNEIEAKKHENWAKLLEG